MRLGIKLVRIRESAVPRSSVDRGNARVWFGVEAAVSCSCIIPIGVISLCQERCYKVQIASMTTRILIYF